MSTVATAERVNPVVVFRNELDNMEGQFQAALPAHIPVERFCRVLMTAIQQNPELLECERRSLWNAAIKAAQDGLLPDGREGAMVVRKDRNRGKLANWQPMIAGIRKKVRNSGEIATWDAHCVYEGDEFQFKLGDDPGVHHAYDLKAPRGKIIGAYSVAVMKDGQKSYEVMTIGEIRAIRDRSDAWKAFKAGFIKSTPWQTDEGEMCRKTVARRHSKVLPMSTDLDDLVRRDEEHYQFDDAKEQSKATGSGTLASRLDALAKMAPAEPETEHDPKTGEIKQLSLQGSDSAQRTADENPEPAVRSDSRSGPEDGSESGGKRQASEQSESGGAPSTSSAGAKQDPVRDAEAHAISDSGVRTAGTTPPTGAKQAAKDDSAELEKHDQALATAAKSGIKALDEAIAKVPEPHRTTLKMAIERRHRPAAAAAAMGGVK